MSMTERDEWREAIHELHRDCHWFRDKRGMIFSALWYEAVVGGD